MSGAGSLSPMVRSGANVQPRVDGDNVLATYGANNIRIYTHSSGQTRIQATNWIRFRPLNGYFMVDAASANNLFYLYNSAADDYIGAQAVTTTPSYGIISTNKYDMYLSPKTGLVVIQYGGVNTIVRLHDAAAAIAIKLDSTAGHVSLLKDNASLIMGAGSDASVYYDGTNLKINPKLVGTGYASINGSVEVPAADAFYLGDAATNGSWRIIRSGNNLNFERRETGVWVSKGSFIP